MVTVASGADPYAHMRILADFMSTTAARRRLIRTLIREQPVDSQHALVGLLADHGFAVTQATVSRDLQALGAAKDGDGYVIADERHHQATALAHAIDEFAEAIVTSGNVVVVKTPPGAAHLLAASIDAADLDGLIGTVAGDDTILIVASEHIGAPRLAKELERIGAMR